MNSKIIDLELAIFPNGFPTKEISLILSLFKGKISSKDSIKLSSIKNTSNKGQTSINLSANKF